MIMTVQVFSGSDPRDRTSAYSSPSKHYRLCGTELPGVVSITRVTRDTGDMRHVTRATLQVSSSGNVMSVVMVSDSTVTSRGFRARSNYYLP